MESKSIYLIICEGDSEVAYVQELNRYLNEREGTTVFLAINAGGGGFSTIRKCCRSRKTRRNGRTFVFADKDIYERNDNGNGASYEREKEVLPPFLFQSWNFEDFLLMHFPRRLVLEWREISALNGHLKMPKQAQDYAPIYAAFCQNHKDELGYELPYEKGDMPFALTTTHVENLLENNNHDFPHSEFARLIGKAMSK